MKTLYIRIVVTFVLIALASGFFALFVANYYYQTKLRDFNEQKILRIGSEIRALYEDFPGMPLDRYLTRIADMGFQLYAVDAQGEGRFYGAPFKHRQFAPDQISQVLEGQIYRGMTREPHWLTIVGFFENSVQNSIGLPIEVNGQTYALFVRPNLEQQIGEVRLLVAVLFGFTFLFSLVLIVVLSRYIVKPVKELTAATQSIVGGNYDVKLDVGRKDEIGNMARHFTSMAGSLKRLDDMRQEFVANVSHEIQSPLTSIQGFAQAALDEDTPPEDRTRYVQIIDQESRRLSSLSKQLLTLAALDNEAGTVRRETYRLDEQLREAVIAMEWQWTEKQLAVELDLAESTVTADRELLHQVWQNLLANAIKFTAAGGTIRVESRVGDNAVIVRISDTGIGIAAEVLPHIFERFYKEDKSRNRNREGSGLGLAIVYKIVSLHGGAIEASSILREGTTMTVTLPL